MFGLIICPNCHRFTQRYRECCAHCGAELPGAEALPPADRDPYALVLRRSPFQLVLVGLVLLGIGLFALWADAPNNVIWLLSLVVGGLVLAAAFIPGLQDTSPCVIIDTQGIEDRRPGGAGFIPWKDVKQVFGRRTSKHHWLCVRPKVIDPQTVQSGLGWAMYRLNKKMGWDYKSIRVSGLDASLSDILLHISRLQDQGKMPASIDVKRRHPWPG